MTLWPLLLLSAAASTPDTIVFDTDCGFFGDDGSALAIVLRSPEKVRVAGITVVSGNVWAAESARYVGEILSMLGHAEMRPALGAQMPLVHSPSMAALEGPLEFQGAFGDPLKIAPPVQPNAIDLLTAAVREHPGRITILALGPMTNVAMLLRLHPDLEERIRRIVFMGGNVHVSANASAAAEFNFWFDPEAAQAVLRSRIPEKIMFPLDICNRAVVTKARFDEIIAVHTPITERYRQDYGLRYPGYLTKPAVTGVLWDELPAAWLLDTGVVTKYETAWLDVDTRFGKTYGATIPLDRKLAPEATSVQVMLDLDFERVWAIEKRLLTAGGAIGPHSARDQPKPAGQ